MIYSVTHTPSWALWLAFGLGILNLMLWTLLFYYARSTWRKLKPSMMPYIEMLRGINTANTSTVTGGEPASAACGETEGRGCRMSSEKPMGAFTDRCVEVIRKIVEGSEEVRQQGLVEACAILNEHYAARDAARPKTGYDALSDADKAEWHEMVAEMRDSATKSCTCGFPRKECIRVVLRNGPPYPPRPCEPTELP